MDDKKVKPSKAVRHGLSIMMPMILFLGLTVVLALATKTKQPAPVTSTTIGAPQSDGARNGHSEYLVSLTRKALREGFPKDNVMVLEPQRGPGREAVVKQLMELASRKDSPFGARLSTRGLKAAPADDRNTTLIGPNSYLKVSADGTKFRFRGNIDDPAEIEKARSGGQSISKDELEKVGRRFVESSLKNIVRLGQDESLVFLGAKYLHEDSMSADQKEQHAEITANIAVFGREVRGVPVIGPGSKVAVWFANNRQPVGVDVDWPVYKVSRTRQGVLSRDRLFERVRATTLPTTGSDNAAVSRFECGYIDLGATKRGAGIQSGCAILYSSRKSDENQFARVEFIPAGDQVLTDAKWPLARLIAEGKTINTDTAEFAKYVSQVKTPRTAPAPRSPTGKQP